MPYFNYSGKKIFYKYQDKSSQNSLILIHGSGNNSNIWRNQFNLKINYNISSIDLPSHGKSDCFPKLSLDLYVNVIRSLLDLLKIKEPILCGHSLGGAIIQEYYFRHPTEVKALILCGTGGRLRVSPLILDSLKSNYQEFLNSLSMAFYRTTPQSIIKNYIEETSKTGSQITFQDFKICDNFDTLDKTHIIIISCLILCGDSDYLTPLKYSQYFHKNIRNSKLVIIEKAGHMLMIEKPKEFNQAIENFINNELN